MNTAALPFVLSMREALQTARLPGSGIGWLDSARAEAMQSFLANGLPTTRNELWKYTALRALSQRAYAARDEQAATRAIDESASALPGIDGPRLVFVNGAFHADLSKLDALPQGLSLMPLSQALADQPEPLRFLLARRPQGNADAFASLNIALASDGALLRITAGAQIEAPVHLVHIGAAADHDVAWHSRGYVEIGENASLRLIEHHVGAGENTHFANLACDVVLRERASLDLVIVQDVASGTTLLRRTDFDLRDDARVTLHALELGGALTRHEIRAMLDGDRARFESRGAFALRARQHADTELLIEHRGRDTASDALWRGVADDRARGVFHGAITVAQGADGADAKLSNKNLLLSRDAEIDTRPVLEIHADEVKAAHGATVGQLDERTLFYLRSRGINAEDARILLVRAFCAAALSRIEPQALREHIEMLLLAHLPKQIAP
ncbi:MAG: Fe-S cluster assembly protein SufD [Rhodanobacteraceae bacterium]